MKHSNHNGTEPQRIDRRLFLHRTGTVVTACLGVPLLAGCEIIAARDDNRFSVQMTQRRRFEPASLTIPLGSVVVWDNTSQRRHTVTTNASELENADAIALPTGVTAWDSGDLFAGETWTHTFNVAGSYVYVCRYHGDEGMIGSIVVED